MGPNLSEEVTETNCEDEAQYDITQYKPKQGEVQSWQGSYISSETAHSASESTCWESTSMQIFFYLHTVHSFLLKTFLGHSFKRKRVTHFW